MEKTDGTANFFAMMQRMKYINRWGLMRNTEQENIQEHSMQVSMIAHALALLRTMYFAEGRTNPDPERVALLGLYHDAGEILTGDLPTPVKYFNSEIRSAYKAVEQVAAEKLLAMLPEDMRPVYRSLLLPDKNDPVIYEALKLVKAADKISAYIKCLTEEKAGNPEFVQARIATEKIVKEFEMPEVDYFIERFLPAFGLSLDQLSTDSGRE
jgi:5'-deoxynucleotidase